MRIKVNKAKFVEWLLSEDEYFISMIKDDLLASLKTDGTYTITTAELIDRAVYIPGEIIVPSRKTEIYPEDHEIILGDEHDGNDHSDLI